MARAKTPAQQSHHSISDGQTARQSAIDKWQCRSRLHPLHCRETYTTNVARPPIKFHKHSLRVDTRTTSPVVEGMQSRGYAGSFICSRCNGRCKSSAHEWPQLSSLTASRYSVAASGMNTFAARKQLSMLRSYPAAPPGRPCESAVVSRSASGNQHTSSSRH